MVGGCLGLALGQSSLRVAIVEAREFSAKQSDATGKRAIALSWGSRCILDQLGIWPQVKEAAMAIEHIHVSDKGHFGKTRLSAASQNVDALGYVVEAAQIEAVVAKSIETAAVDNLCPASLVDYVVHQDSADVTIMLNGKEKTLSCQLLVGADGGLSKVREKGNFELKEYSYDQQAITGLIQVESDDQTVAYERFTSEGPIAMLPHFDGLYSLVWTMPSDRAQQTMQLTEDEFLQRLQSRFGQWLGELKLSGKCQTFPLNLSHVPQNTADRVVLIGNAAHQLHPVAGQGFNLGLRDAALLADALMADDIKDMESILEAYAQQRKTDQMLITGFTDNVIKLFSTDNAVFSLVRNSGLLMLDKIPLLKSQFARQTMGLGSRLARLKAV
ncbi:MAG: 2-octaprenyl-3-methyl-6-methoxy-1,4-benzoquinol hydroxylase [Cycloclasticus sp. symbiont of Bathymodiolus heckerae]|nr:MAG: 2-octaprenyl-3-methyl-6-methoxy-1,4-benzoquinol hydroxylase [Cycloclasticus sp. symbiont of Bathymodiolus heckerae]